MYAQIFSAALSIQISYLISDRRKFHVCYSFLSKKITLKFTKLLTKVGMPCCPHQENQH